VSGGIVPHVLTSGPPEKGPPYPLDTELGGLQSRARHIIGEEIRSLSIVPAGNRALVVQPVAQPLHWLIYPASFGKEDLH